MIDVLRDRAIFFDGLCGEIVRYDEVPIEYRAQRKDTHHELVEYLVRFYLTKFPIFGNGCGTLGR